MKMFQGEISRIPSYFHKISTSLAVVISLFTSRQCKKSFSTSGLELVPLLYTWGLWREVATPWFGVPRAAIEILVQSFALISVSFGVPKRLVNRLRMGINRTTLERGETAVAIAGNLGSSVEASWCLDPERPRKLGRGALMPWSRATESANTNSARDRKATDYSRKWRFLRESERLGRKRGILLITDPLRCDWWTESKQLRHSGSMLVRTPIERL